jgi:signal peptidase I
MTAVSDRNTLRLAANVLGVLIIVAVVAPFVVYAVPSVVGADHGLVVLSGSMEPKMSPGDAVIVREVPPSEIEEQDIITFQRAGSDTPTTHRVIEVQQSEEGAAYVTKGDANEEPDRGTVPHSRVIGEVIFVIPFLGHVIQFANTQAGFLTLVLTPLVLFVLSELWGLVKSVREPDPAQADDPTTVTATETAVESGSDTEDGDGLTFTRSSLQLVLLLFGLYVPYSAYVAVTTREAWSIAVATGTVIGFLFSLVLYLASRGANSSTGGERSIDGVVRRGQLPTGIGDRTTIPLDSVESLIQMALDRDDWVIYDEEQETYYMTQDDALYLHRTAPETDGGRAVGEDDSSSHPRTTGEDRQSTDGNLSAEDGGET